VRRVGAHDMASSLAIFGKIRKNSRAVACHHDGSTSRQAEKTGLLVYMTYRRRLDTAWIFLGMAQRRDVMEKIPVLRSGVA